MRHLVFACFLLTSAVAHGGQYILERDLDEIPHAAADASAADRAAADAELARLERDYLRFRALPLDPVSKRTRSRSWERKLEAARLLVDRYLALITRYRAPHASVCAWSRVGDTHDELRRTVVRDINIPVEVTRRGPDGVETFIDAYLDGPEGTDSMSDAARRSYERALWEAARLEFADPIRLGLWESRCVVRAEQGAARHALLDR